MKMLIIISIYFIVSCIGSTTTQSDETFTLDKPFIIDVFIPYYSYFTMTFAALPTGDLIVSNTSYITFKLTNGILSSGSNGATYYLKNQTGERYPGYALRQGQAKPGDVSIFKSSRDYQLVGRYIAPNITTDIVPGSYNRWVACKTSDGIYTIGWDLDATTQPPEGCINYAKYNPGVLVHVSTRSP